MSKSKKKRAGIGYSFPASADDLPTLGEALDDLRAAYLKHALLLAKGNVTEVAEMAGIERANVYVWVRKHKIKVEDYRE